MPKLLELSPAQRAKIQRLYLKGQAPAEIALSLRASGLNLTAKQIGNMAVREKWTAQRGDITDARQKTAIEVLESVRAAMSRDLEEILTSVVEDLKSDALKLRSGDMDLAMDAAGVSAVQRGKKLFFERVKAVAGLDEKPGEGVTRINLLAAVYGRPENFAPVAVDVTVTGSTQAGSADTETSNAGDDLEFAEEES